MTGRLHPATLRAGLWAYRATRRARRQLQAGGIDSVQLPPAPAVTADAERGMMGVLKRTQATCLISALVRQEWEAAHGHRRELVVGVTAPSRGFEAHAWLDGEDSCHHEQFVELLRRPAR